MRACLPACQSEVKGGYLPVFFATLLSEIRTHPTAHQAKHASKALLSPPLVLGSQASTTRDLHTGGQVVRANFQPFHIVNIELLL